MFRALGKFFRAIGYLFTGRIDDARRALNTNPQVIRATFDAILEEKRKRVQQYKEAVGSMIAQSEKKREDLKVQSEEVVKLKKLRDGAAAMARKVVERHGGNAEAVKQDPEYLRCQAAYKDFSSTLAEKESRCTELEADIKGLEGSVGNHKAQLESLLRELEKIQQEKHETVADILTAKEEREVADLLSGISQDRTNQELQELREQRREAKATARVSRELAGIDTKRSEQEFLEYASHSEADNEFDKLIGLAQKEPPSAEPPAKTMIPEK